MWGADSGEHEAGAGAQVLWQAMLDQGELFARQG